MVALGLVLLIAGLVSLAVEAHAPAHGALAVPGIGAIAAGTVLAVDGAGGGLAVGLVAALVIAASALGVAAVALRRGVAARHRRIRSGPEALTGRIGVVQTWTGGGGQVALDGGLWTAAPEQGCEQLSAGDRVVVDAIHGLTLVVRPAEDWELVGW